MSTPLLFKALTIDEVKTLEEDNQLLRVYREGLNRQLSLLERGQALQINKSIWHDKYKGPPNISIASLKEQGMKFEKMTTKDGIYYVIQRVR